jgi:hypothetical protein
LDKWFDVIVFHNGTIKVEGGMFGNTTLHYSKWHGKPNWVAERALEKASAHPYRKLEHREFRCHIDCCVTMYNEKVLNPVQTWLPGFSAICLYTTIGMASEFRPHGSH